MPGGTGADGPIIDLQAKRVGEPPKGAKPEPAGAAKPGGAVGPEPKADRPTGGAGFGTIAAAGLLGGVVGAGLLFAVERATAPGGNDSRIAALDQRVGGLAPRDALSTLEKRVAANEAALKPLPDAVRTAEATARQALDKAGTTPAASGEAQPAQSGAQPAQSGAQATPQLAELSARLDSLDQRVSALQEEPGKDEVGKDEAGKDRPGSAPVTATQGGSPGGVAAGEVAALDQRVKALEGKVSEPAKAAPDLAPRIAALRSDIEARTKANAESGRALGQRLDGLQKTLDERVKAATEAVQTAAQASRDAAEAGRQQAAETTKALDRRVQEQGEQIAALGTELGERAKASTVQAAVRLVVLDRIATALSGGAPYAEPLASLRAMGGGGSGAIDALAPLAAQGAPTAAQLAAAFRPIAERIAAARKAEQARSVAETGDIRARLMSMADAVIQVRKVDEAQPQLASAGSDPAAQVQEALDRGALQDAAKAFDALPDAAKAEAGDFGARLKARAAAGAAVQTLLADALKGLPATEPAPAR